MGEDILKKPVHIAVLKPTHVQKLAAEGKFPNTPFSVEAHATNVPLPAPVVEKRTLGLEKIQRPKVAHSDVVKKTKKQMHLRVLHDRVPPIPEDRKPPCESCKTSACCYAFTVNITKEEYESGLYGDAAIELTPEVYKQLKSQYLTIAMFGTPQDMGKPAYFLEGKVSEPCPFLTPEKRCGIYDIRPVTCRTYSCVGDSRITEGMRQGTESLNPITRFYAALERDKDPNAK